MKSREKKQSRGKRSDRAVTILLTVIFFVGLSVFAYPSVSAWWNSRVESRAVASYREAAADVTKEEAAAYLEAAASYNEALYRAGSAAALSRPERIGGYEETLDIDGTGMMGFVTIDKLNVELPIYHGTTSRVLSSGAGHLEGSSLPVGGPNTHSVISAHRGLPSARLFTNLDRLEEGDLFTVTVLDQVLTYEVDQISIVLPSEFENLYIEPGEDYCTLMTCTPYGINTHRLLVRGVRTETEGGENRLTADARRIDSFLVAPFLAVPLLLLLLVFLWVRTRRRKKNDKRTHGITSFI